ncbi:energy transducer TonB [Aurantiacibacter flavus]|uniref:TonB family protein n=1 Tax=Aurantiacibacter flavus TaxID=3145232 RepID=A0ABV0D0E8_9SPHN
MYAETEIGWNRQKLASVGLSVCINFGIFAGFAMFTQLSGVVSGKEESLSVFALGTQGDEAAQEAAAPPPPPPETPPSPQKPHESAMEKPELVLLPRPAPPEEEAEEEPPQQPTPLSIEPSHPQPQAREISPPAQAAPRSNPHQRNAAQQDAAAQTSASSNSTAQAGEGDAYGASVYAHLLRYRTSNVVGPGLVRIRLTVLADGSARETSIVHSSGSSRFDRAALQMVRRASPFPRPPDGTSHTFDFGIKGS